MSRYFFHVHDGEDFIDLQGTELANLDEARRESLRFAGALLRDRASTFWDTDEWRMRIADERDRTLFELMFSAREDVAAPAELERT